MSHTPSPRAVLAAQTRAVGAALRRPALGAAAVLGTNDHTDLFEVLGGGHGRR